MTSTRYPASCAATARRLHEAGWSLARIADLIYREHGVRPARSTVGVWVQPRDAAYRRRVNARFRQRRGTWSFRLQGREHTPEFRAGFARALRAEGVPVPSIVKASRVVFATAMDEREVRRAIAEEAVPA